MGSDDQRLEQITNELPLGLWVARVPSGELVYANKTFQEIMGIAARDDVGVGGYAEPYGICDRAGRPYPEDRMPFVRAIEAREQVTVDDIVIHRHDGRHVYIRARARPLFAADGTLEMVSIAFLDITREVEAQREVQRIQRLEAVGTLAGGIAHDFNNLLTGVQVLADALRETEVDIDRREQLETILHATTKASALTKALLGFARRGKHLSQPVDLSATVRSVSNLLSRTLNRAVAIELDVQEVLPVRGDPTQLEQVVMNLVLNAAEAMPDGGRVHIRLQPRGDQLELEIHDEGPGIPEAIRDRVFEPYFTTKTGGDARTGTGLGLAMVLGIVEAHGGSVELAPTNQGARVRVLLPTMEPTPPRSTRPTVLVVDDEPLVLQASRAALRVCGCDALLAPGGKEALQLLGDHPVDLVLLDLVMPGMDGAETYAALAARHPELPVVVCTGFAANDRVQELLDAGAAGLLAKPFSLDELRAAVQRATQRERA